MPELGERIRGDILLSMKGRSNDYYVWHQCPKCLERRWILDWKTRLPNFTGLCLMCNGKRLRTNGEMKTYAGYVLILDPKHPSANSRGYVRRSRLVLEKKMGRPLLPNCLSHHLNGVKDDDRPRNLLEIPKRQHPTLHAIQREMVRQAKKEVVEFGLFLEKNYSHTAWGNMQFRMDMLTKLKKWGID